MTPKSRGLRLLPILVALPYLFATWLLFLFGPYVWPVRAWWAIYLLVPSAFLALGAGFLTGIRGEARGAAMPSAPMFLWIGAIAAVVLLIPSTVVYTGKLPWQLSGALQSQKEAYSALADQLASTAGSRGPVALARTIFGPFIFSVLPLYLLLRERASKVELLLVLATVGASIIFSIQRGTSSQLADIAIVAIAAYMVRIGAYSNSLAGIARHWKSIAVGAVFVVGSLVTVVGRTEARLGGQNIRCLDQSGACVDLSSGVYGQMSDTMAFGSAAISGYFSQGYYGVALAAEKDFEPTWGIGHSPAAAAVFVMLGGDEDFANRTYTYRARADGWSDQTQWSSLITWLANDFSLWGAVAVLFGLGWLWGRTWLDATVGGDLRAAILFCVLAMMVFYLPANNYMLATYDGYATVVFWLIAWAWGRRARA